MTTYKRSTYRVPVELYQETDTGREEIAVEDLEQFRYVMSENRSRGDILFDLTLDDAEVSVPNPSENVVVVLLRAEDMDVPRKVHEEVRLSLPGTSSVTNKRMVEFDEVITEPPEYY